MSDQETFLRRIRELPECDNLRLIYAEWLDDHPFLACTCDDGSQDTGGTTPWGEWISIKCPNCDGTGNLHHGFPERAHFIRIQCEIAAQKRGERQASEANDRIQDELSDAEMRAWGTVQNDLGEEIRDWWQLVLGHSKCYRCDFHKSVATFPHQAIYRRGFVDEVVCTIGQWMGFGPCGGCSGVGWYVYSSSPNEQRPCEVCDGLGGQPAIGPLVVASQPVLKVRFPDWMPADRTVVNERWYWFRSRTTPFESQQSAEDAISAAALLWAKDQLSATVTTSQV